MNRLSNRSIQVSAVTLSACAALLAIGACEAGLPTAGEAERPPVASVDRSVRASATSDPLTVVIDSMRASEEASRSGRGVPGEAIVVDVMR